MASKCTKDAENVYAPLVVEKGRKRTLADKTADQNGPIDTSICFHLAGPMNPQVLSKRYSLCDVPKKPAVYFILVT
jgi:hypothetical protein